MDSTAIEQINQLDLFSRREFKLGGVVLDTGEIKDMEEYNLISKLTVCELMMNLGENMISENNLLTIIKKCGVDQIPFDLKRYSPKPSKMPEIEELQF